jgi:predicted NBD/HSP70 family sugar kinase
MAATPNPPAWQELYGNTRRVAETLRAYGPRTRAELVTLTGLSRPTVSAALIELSTAGLVAEQLGSAARPIGGRPASVVRLTRAAGLAVGVDIGRRHIRVAVADLGHRVLSDQSARVEPDADEAPMHALDLAGEMVGRVLRDVAGDPAAVVGVGLGIPAPITSDGRIGAPALLPAWTDLRPADELARRVAMPVRLENDANLGALGEYTWGAGRGYAHFVYIKLATGIGAGIVLDGRLYRGAAGTAGELGHVTIDARGPVCRCGNRGCLELSAGGRALLAHVRLSHPDFVDITELLACAGRGDPGCRRLLADAGTHLGVAIGSLVNLLSPQRIVLGGELSAAVDLLREPIRRGLGETAMPAPVRAVEVVGGDLGERAAALGGVALALGVDSVPLAVG